MNSIPRPDFSNIIPNTVSIDTTPKVSQKQMEERDSEEDSETTDEIE
jgi:hypothetical protein